MFAPFNPDYIPSKEIIELQDELTKVEERMDYLEYLDREWNTDEELEYEDLEKQQKEIKISMEAANERR
jgi:hypothetical protein